MTFRDLGPFFICRLLMLLIMAMIGVYNVLELADLVFDMDSLDLGIVKVCSWT